MPICQPKHSNARSLTDPNCDPNMSEPEPEQGRALWTITHDILCRKPLKRSALPLLSGVDVNRQQLRAGLIASAQGLIHLIRKWKRGSGTLREFHDKWNRLSLDPSYLTGATEFVLRTLLVTCWDDTTAVRNKILELIERGFCKYSDWR